MVFTHRGKSKTIPYADIKSLRVIDYANAGAVHGQCTVKTGSHGKYNIRSHHFVSLGGFQDRNETYVPFVRELCRRAHAANPAAQFLSGSGWLQVLWIAVLMIAVFGWIALFATLSEGGGDAMYTLGYGLSLAAITYFSARWLLRSKPDLFDPNDPPVG